MGRLFLYSRVRAREGLGHLWEALRLWEPATDLASAGTRPACAGGGLKDLTATVARKANPFTPEDSRTGRSMNEVA